MSRVTCRVEVLGVEVGGVESIVDVGIGSYDGQMFPIP